MKNTLIVLKYACRAKMTLFFLILFFGVISCTTSEKESENKITIGAIRWDAWTGGEITSQVERTLGPEKYHHRLPWFADIVDENTVTIDGSPQKVMDQEILWAAGAGLDYWAILIYPGGNSMSVALDQYLQSKHRNKLKFCMILANTLNVSDENWPYERGRIVSLINESGYQHVLDNRPLMYVFNAEHNVRNRMGRIEELRAIFKNQGLDPYWVYMGWNPANDWDNAQLAGFDAVSNYAYGGGQSTFQSFAEATENAYWQLGVEAGVKLMPLATTGWDKQPRADNPVSWEPVTDDSYHSRIDWPPMPTPVEFAEHLGRGIDFIRKHPAHCEAKSIIIYAWNEYDEGGWLAPTLGRNGKPDTSRLDAIQKIINRN